MMDVKVSHEYVDTPVVKNWKLFSELPAATSDNNVTFAKSKVDYMFTVIDYPSHATF